jgi:hypothetical protein
MNASVIVISNNKLLLKENLLTSLNKFDSNLFSFQLIVVDNTSNRFHSAAKALIYGLSKAIYDIVFFTHQDIQFLDCQPFTKSINFLLKNPMAIVGAAGSIDGNIYSNISNGTKPYYPGSKVDKPVHVQTLDECFFATTKEVLSLVSFDPKICKGWHLYGADFCLSAKRKNIYSYVLPSFLHHLSTGKLNKSYFSTLLFVYLKHFRFNRIISTTGLSLNDSFFINILKILRDFVNYPK